MCYTPYTEAYLHINLSNVIHTFPVQGCYTGYTCTQIIIRNLHHICLTVIQLRSTSVKFRFLCCVVHSNVRVPRGERCNTICTAHAPCMCIHYVNVCSREYRIHHTSYITYTAYSRYTFPNVTYYIGTQLTKIIVA